MLDTGSLLSQGQVGIAGVIIFAVSNLRTL